MKEEPFAAVDDESTGYPPTQVLSNTRTVPASNPSERGGPTVSDDVSEGVSLFVAVSMACGTITPASVTAASHPVLVSHAGVRLTRATTFRFTFDVNRAQHKRLMAHAGAARLAFNHHSPG